MKVSRGEGAYHASMSKGGKGPRRITIKDVARLAGVSVTTASVALRRSAPVSERTRQRVLEAARVLRYHPNRLARTLVLRRSTLVGLLVPDIADPYFHEIIKGIESALARHGFSVVLCDADRFAQLQSRCLAELRELQVWAVIALGAEEYDEASLGQLQEEGVRVVLIGRSIPGFARIDIRNDEAGRLAARYLLGLGHRRIAFVMGPERNEAALLRLQGYREVLQGAGVWDPRLEFPGAFDVASGYEAMHRILALCRDLPEEARPTAVLACNDQMGIGALQAALRAGVRVPGEMSLMGIGGIMLTNHVYPALSTVALPLRDMGYVVGEFVCTASDGSTGREILAEVRVPPADGEPAPVPVLPLRLLSRDSTAPPVK